MYAALMSTNRNVANLSIAVVKTLAKMASFGLVADMIHGSQECLNLLADIKNDALGNPNAEMIRSLNGAVKSELDAIQDALKHNGLGKKQVKRAAAQLAEAARETIKNLAEDDNALIRAVQQPQCFAEQLRGHAAPLPHLSSDEMQAHYETLLDRISEEFQSLAPWSPNFDHVALTELLRCFPALTDQIARVEHKIQEVGAKVDAESERSREADADTHRKLDALKDMVGSFTPTERKPLRVAFGSRPDVVAGDRFVERNEHKQLKALITDPTRQRTVLLGMRGCGKTQLAASLARQCEDANWDLVAWINAISPESIKSDLVELAKQVGIGTSDQPTQDQVILRFLSRVKSAKPADRLIIFDNVEDINDLRGLMPSGNGLRVIATTTNDTGWEHQDWTTIKVGVFDRSESINHLLIVTKSDDYDSADALAERLGDLPLAITQAAATACNSDRSLTRYLERLDAYGSERVIHPVPGDYYTDDVATALCMAIEGALDNLTDNTKQAALQQLGTLALLAESGVPTRWLDPTFEQLYDDEPPGTQRDTDEDAHDALTELIQRSVVQQSADRSTTMIHRLQAQVLRESWNEKETAEAYESAAILLGTVNVDRFARNNTDSRRRETRDLIEQLHAIYTNWDSNILFEKKSLLGTLSQAFIHAFDLGISRDILPLSDTIHTVCENLGYDQPIALALRSNIAHAYAATGNTSISIELYEGIVADSIRVQGQSHPQTLVSSNNLADVYRSAGYFKEAITIYERVVVDSMRVHGKSHPQTLTACNNLATTYESAGQLDLAIPLFSIVFEVRTRVLGPEHPQTLTSQNNLAGAYQAAGRIDDAIPLFQATLEIRTRVLGPEHPDTLESRHNLAGAYHCAGLFPEAIECYTRVIAERKKFLNGNHPDTLVSINNLAHAYASNCELARAIERFEEALTGCASIFGPKHPFAVKVREDLEAARRELVEQEEGSRTEESDA